MCLSIGWSEELVVDAWTNDRDGACEKAGIDLQTASNEELQGSINPYASLVMHKVSSVREGREK